MGDLVVHLGVVLLRVENMPLSRFRVPPLGIITVISVPLIKDAQVVYGVHWPEEQHIIHNWPTAFISQRSAHPFNHIVPVNCVKLSEWARSVVLHDHLKETETQLIINALLFVDCVHKISRL